MSFTIFAIAQGLSSLLPHFFSTDLVVHFGTATQGLVLAQQVPNVDLMGNIQNGWTDFLQTGKAGALAVGLVLGYTIRGITR